MIKATDFRREHFEKGRAFSQADFDAYIGASAKYNKSMWTTSLPIQGAGLVLGVILGELEAYFPALICIFAGLIAAGAVNIKKSRAVMNCAKRLGITPADVRQARRHVKAGTVAWTDALPAAEPARTVAAPVFEAPAFCRECGARLRQNAAFCPGCGKPVPTAPVPAAPAAAEPAPARAAVKEKPMRAVWACVILTAGYFLIVGLLSLFSERLASQADILFFLDVTALAAAVYLITRPQLKYRLFGAGAAALSVFLRLTSGVVTGSGVLMRLRRFTVWELLDYSARIVHWRQVARPLLAAGLTVGAAVYLITRPQLKYRLFGAGAAAKTQLEDVAKANTADLTAAEAAGDATDAIVDGTAEVAVKNVKNAQNENVSVSYIVGGSFEADDAE